MLLLHNIKSTDPSSWFSNKPWYSGETGYRNTCILQISTENVSRRNGFYDKNACVETLMKSLHKTLKLHKLPESKPSQKGGRHCFTQCISGIISTEWVIATQKETFTDCAYKSLKNSFVKREVSEPTEYEPSWQGIRIVQATHAVTRANPT